MNLIKVNKVWSIIGVFISFIAYLIKYVFIVNTEEVIYSVAPMGNSDIRYKVVFSESFLPWFFCIVIPVILLIIAIYGIKNKSKYMFILILVFAIINEAIWLNDMGAEVLNNIGGSIGSFQSYK